jgi:hypothetical protein
MIPLTENSWQYEILTTGLAQCVLVMKTMDGKLRVLERVSPLLTKARALDGDWGVSEVLLGNAKKYGISGEGGLLPKLMGKIGKVRVPLTGDATVESLYESVVSTTTEKVSKQAPAGPAITF